MRNWVRRIIFFLAVLVLLLTFINASWIAERPRGGIKLIAHRGVAQQFSRVGVTDQSCTAMRIEPPVHDYLENSARSMEAARRIGADLVEVDIAPTADGKIAIFHDWTLDCRTNGKGDVRAKSMAELKRLDMGYGYTADDGRTFPFRGQHRDSMPTLEEALAALPTTRILFNFKSNDPAEADQLAAALTAAQRDVVRRGDAFYGAPGPVERIRHFYPHAWAWSIEAAKRCSKDYMLYGWTSIVPNSCRNGTLFIPLNYQSLAWGWPNRLLSRMTAVGAHVIVTGPYHSGEPMAGLNLPEQLGAIPNTFNGYIWVEDIWTVGPAYRPDRDIRTEAQQTAADAGLKRRRALAE